MGRTPLCLPLWCGILHSLQVVGRWASAAGDDSVSVQRGSSAELPCDIPAAADLSRLSVVWSLTPAGDGGPPRQVILFQDGAVIGSPWGTGSRARFIEHPTRSASVHIEGTQREDAGLYQCVTTNPASDHQPRIQTVRLHVLEAPSPPHCAMSGEVALGGSVILTCYSSSGNPAPTYSWWKVDTNRNLMLNSSHSSQGMLVVQNLSADSSGIYLCIASSALGSERCSVELILQILQESVRGMAAGIGITLTMGVIILTLFGTVLWLHSRNTARPTGRNYPRPAGL